MNNKHKVLLMVISLLLLVNAINVKAEVWCLYQGTCTISGILGEMARKTLQAPIENLEDQIQETRQESVPGITISDQTRIKIFTQNVRQ